MVLCVGCGADVPSSDGPTHAYLGASPGCWAVFGEVLAREFGELGYPDVHRLTVDAYAVQHPGQPSPQTIQSVAVHLISLHLVLERELSADKATKAIRWATTHKARFCWLEPPGSLGDLTVLDVHGAADLAEHTRCVTRWAESAWAAWSPHHDTIRRWAKGEG